MMSFEVAKWGLFLYVVSTFLVSTVSGLKCTYLNSVCLSTSSIGGCGNSSKQMTCPDVANRCANISTEVKTEAGMLRSYFYGCATQKMCTDAKEQQKVCEKILNLGGDTAKCKITCCKLDFCVPLAVTAGVGFTSVFSHLLMLPCALMFTLSLRL